MKRYITGYPVWDGKLGRTRYPVWRTGKGIPYLERIVSVHDTIGEARAERDRLNKQEEPVDREV